MNSPPEKRSPGRRRGSVDTERQDSGNRSTNFRVVVDGKQRGMVFRQYAREDEANAAAAALRKAGMAARVEPAEPEFGKSRRRFLVAMFMCGAVKGERIVERVVAELDGE